MEATSEPVYWNWTRKEWQSALWNGPAGRRSVRELAEEPGIGEFTVRKYLRRHDVATNGVCPFLTVWRPQGDGAPPELPPPAEPAPAPVPLPLTRRVLSAWPRFREANGLRDERTVADWCALTEGEVHVLRRLRENLTVAGDPETWLDEDGALRPGILARLMAGLTVAEAELPDLIRACQPPTVGTVWALEAGLTAQIRKEKERAMETEPVMTIETPPSTNGHAAVEETPPEPPTETLRERVRLAVLERGWDLARPLRAGEADALARELGASKNSVATYLRAFRKESGVTVATAATVCTRTTSDPPGRWPNSTC